MGTNLVTIRTPGFQALLKAKSDARSLTDKTSLPPISPQLLDQVGREAILDDNSILGIGHRHLSTSTGPKRTTDPAAAPPPPKPSKKHAKKYGKTLENATVTRDSERREEYIEHMKKLLDEKFDARNLTISEERHRSHAAGLYHTFLKHFAPELDESLYWREATIREWMELFLVNLVQCTKGRSGKQIRSSTLRRWLVSLIPLIGRYASNENGDAVGARLLATGFYLRLRAREKWIVQHFKLSRFPGTKGYLSQRDIQAMFEFGFENTETFGREAFIQTHLSFVIVFQTAIRASSFAAGNPTYREWGHYIKLKDLKIAVNKPGMWEIDVNVFHRKGSNEDTDPGYALEFHLGAVTKVHNLVFDAGLMLLASLLLRDALVDIETVADLFSYDGRFIRIKPSMLEDPLFCERGPRGHTLLNKPASSSGMQDSIRRLGQNVGLPTAKYHDIRRDTANVFGIVFGTEAGRRLLGHGESDTVFDRNYSRGTWNFDVTAARLGDLDSTLDPAAKLSIMRHRSVCMIVDAILNAEARGAGEKNTAKEEHALVDNKFIQLLDETLERLWKDVHAILPNWVYITYETSTGSLAPIEAAIKDYPWYGEIKDQFKHLQSQIIQTAKWRVEIARQVKKRAQHRSVVELQAEFDELQQEHSLDEYKEVETSLVGESAATKIAKTPKDLVRAYNHRFFNFDENAKYHEEISRLEFLSPDIRAQFERPDMMEFLAGHIKEHYPIPEDDDIILQDPNDQLEIPETENEEPDTSEPDTTRDPQIYQEEDIGDFDDSAEVPVFNVDFMLAKVIFFIRLVHPVYAYRDLKRRFEEDNKYYICITCAKWKHLKPPKRAAKFKGYAGYARHMMEIHTPWEDLRIEMLTDDEDILKCPCDSCTFRSDNVNDIFDHCLEGECPDRDLFQKVQESCIVTRNRDDDAAREARKRARALKFGVELSEHSLETMELIATSEDKDILEMAEKAKLEDKEDLPNCLPLVREAVRLALRVLESSSNLVKDEHAFDLLKSMSEKLITEEDEEWIKEELELIDLETVEEPNWAVDDILENVSNATSFSSNEGE